LSNGLGRMHDRRAREQQLALGADSAVTRA